MNNVSSINRYETQKNIDYQYRKGYSAGRTLQSFGYGNELGKTSEALNMAYLEGYAEGQAKRQSDLQQCYRKPEIKLALVA